MAKLHIALRRDAATGKHAIIVKLESDADALPVEHEQMHRKIVEQLLGQGLRAEDLGEIIIERDAAVSAKRELQSEPAQPVATTQ